MENGRHFLHEELLEVRVGRLTGHLPEKNSVIRILDPVWIWIQPGQWIRIRIRNPDPGGQK